jgi:peptidyl-prolyl cis-trans isomerase C
MLLRPILQRSWLRRSMGLTALSAVLLTASVTSADDDTSRRSRVVLRVGARTVTVGELEDRIAEIPPFQLTMFGVTRDEIVHAYLSQVIVRDLLLGAGAEARALDQSFPAKLQLERARSNATLRALRSGDLKSQASIPAEDVARYYETNRARFDAPERVNLWRILCTTKADADDVLAQAKQDLSIPKFMTLARERSLDKATQYRGGNLGFLGPDGASNEAGVKVDPALVRAAASVKDGELVTQPVQEGAHYAVVWRRNTVPATRRTLDEASDQIRATLFRERTEAKEKELLASLRQKHVRDVNADLLKIIEIPAFDAGLGLPRSVPSAIARPAPAPRSSSH